MKSKLSKSESQSSVSSGPIQSKRDTQTTVAERAYSKYEDSGYAPGNEVQHWLDAESELKPSRAKL